MHDDICVRCLSPILLTAPSAMLECSLRSYAADKEDTIMVAHAVGFEPLSCTCGEQLQLTSPVVEENVKLLRYAREIPDIQQALTTLPPLPTLVLVAPDGAGSPDVQWCWGCWTALRDQPHWLDVSLVYEQRNWSTTWQRVEATVLDYYATLSLCPSCQRHVPLPPLSGDVERALHWVAACVALLAQPQTPLLKPPGPSGVKICNKLRMRKSRIPRKGRIRTTREETQEDRASSVGPVDREQKEGPASTTRKRLLSEMTQEEVGQLSEDEYDDLLTEQMLHNLRTHIPDR